MTHARGELISRDDIPTSLRDVLLGFPWDLDRLFDLDLPVEEVRTADFLWLLDLPFWRKGDVVFAVTPNQVRGNPFGYAEQWTRTLETDLTRPIHVTERKGRTVIIDGIHRLLKADIEGRRTLPARRVPREMFSRIRAPAAT